MNYFIVYDFFHADYIKLRDFVPGSVAIYDDIVLVMLIKFLHNYNHLGGSDVNGSFMSHVFDIFGIDSFVDFTNRLREEITNPPVTERQLRTENWRRTL